MTTKRGGLATSMVALAVAALLIVAFAGCVKQGRAVETAPMTDNLGAYWTCAVTYKSDGRGEDANEAFTFVPWFESRVRERGVFEPLGRDEGTEAEVSLRLEASAPSEAKDDVSLHVEIIDTKTKASIGELDAVGVVDPKAAAAEGAEPRRILALRSAAEQILDLLKEKRHQAALKPHHAVAPPPPPLPDGPPVAGTAVCTTQCSPPASTSSSHDEQYRVSAGVNSTMKDLRECLDRVGAQLVVPAVLLRFSPDGQLRHMRVDVGGYEQLECIQNIKSRLPRGVFATRASLLRCEYRCSVS